MSQLAGGSAAYPPPAIADELTRALSRVLPHDTIERCAVALARSGKLLAAEEVARGTASFVSLRMREIAARALSLGADALLIGHNHPSGDPRPSACDLSATRRLMELCMALDIELIDHVIFAGKIVHSMRTGRSAWLSEI